MEQFIRKLKWYHVGILGLLFFIPFLGKVHLFDWDEINFAESAREMIVSKQFFKVQIDYLPFWEKPPFFIWLQVLAMEMFDVSEFAARLPNALTGVFCLCLLFFLGRKLVDHLFAYLWVIVYLGSLLPHLYFKSGIIDPVFNLFIFSSMVMLWKHEVMPDSSKRNIKAYSLLLLAGIFSGLAVWTKGPVGYFIPVLVYLLYLIRVKSVFINALRSLSYFSFTAILLSLLWILLTIKENGLSSLMQFGSYMWRLAITEEAGHGGPFYYHIIVLVIGCFPLSLFAFPFLCGNDYHPEFSIKDSRQVFFRMMWLLFWTVLLIFSLVQTKIIHYSSLCYFPMSFMAARWLYLWIQNKVQWKSWMTILFFVLGITIGLALTIIPLFGTWPSSLGPLVKDKFIQACLKSPVEWMGFEWLVGMGYIIFLIFFAARFKQKALQFVSGIFLGTAIMLFIYLPLIVPKIEAYTQRPAIDFCKSFVGQDVYIQTIGFKSYLHYYYFDKPPHVKEEASNAAWILDGPIDKPAYFISRVDRNGELKSRKGIDSLYQSGGFVFYRRPLGGKDIR